MTGPLAATVDFDAAVGAASAALVALAALAAWSRRALRAASSRERAALRRVEAAEAEVSTFEAAAANAERAAHHHDRALQILWRLAELSHERQRAEQAALTPGARPAGAPGLGGGLGLLVERIREEAGIPGELTLDLAGGPPPAEVSLIVLEALEALLDAVVRRCDHFAIELRERPGVLGALVVGSGFDGGEPTVEEARRVVRLLRGAGVDGTVAAVGGNLEAELDFPVAAPS